MPGLYVNHCVNFYCWFIFKAILAFLFFIFENNYCQNQDNSSDSGISESWRGSPSEADSSETTPLILTTIEAGYRMYTEEKIQYYGKSRKLDNEVKINYCLVSSKLDIFFLFRWAILTIIR